MALFEVLQKTKKDEERGEGFRSFIWVPRDFERGDDLQNVVTVVSVSVGALNMSAILDRETEDG
jgi:hypothetical protein